MVVLALGRSHRLVRAENREDNLRASRNVRFPRSFMYWRPAGLFSFPCPRVNKSDVSDSMLRLKEDVYALKDGTAGAPCSLEAVTVHLDRTEWRITSSFACAMFGAVCAQVHVNRLLLTCVHAIVNIFKVMQKEFER